MVNGTAQLAAVAAVVAVGVGGGGVVDGPVLRVVGPSGIAGADVVDGRPRGGGMGAPPATVVEATGGADGGASDAAAVGAAPEVDVEGTDANVEGTDANVEGTDANGSAEVETEG